MSTEMVKQVTVIGAGQMGHQIGMLCALGGYETIIHDAKEEALGHAKQTLETIMDQWVRKGKISEDQKMAAFSRLEFKKELKEAVQEADFVIEAIVEILDAKKELFAKLEEYAPDHTIFATNSSTIVNSLIAGVTKRPEKVINMHFFFPPLVMDCIEVVVSEQTSERTAQITMEVCKTINRTAVLLNKEISGFIANRILGAQQREALYLYENGYADFEAIDAICRKALGHPIGPFQLMDLSGIDVCYYVAQQRYEETGDPLDKPAACIEEKLRLGHLGRKTGKGWYEYKKEGIKK
jgi:3-hydroxybutyryl-CoA dehydrogenase